MKKIRGGHWWLQFRYFPKHKIVKALCMICDEIWYNISVYRNIELYICWPCQKRILQWIAINDPGSRWDFLNLCMFSKEDVFKNRAIGFTMRQELTRFLIEEQGSMCLFGGG